MITASHVRRAHQRIQGIIHHTPVIHSRTLDEMAGGTVFLKMESFQRTGAFKFRGAFHALGRRLDRARETGVVTASSGNHGGAVALAARILGIKACVVVPQDIRGVKRTALDDYGAEVITCGLTSEERVAKARELVEERGLMMIPPYDDEDIMSGQGTTALESLEQVPDLEVFLAPCGGGGLLAGCAAFLADEAPHVEVWGVEAEVADDTHRSMAARERVKIDLPDTVADGMRNLTPGELTFPVIQKCCRGIALVSEDQIRAALRLLMLKAKVAVEPTGAVATAAALFRKVDLQGRTAVAVVSGGNADPGTLVECLV